MFINENTVYISYASGDKNSNDEVQKEMIEIVNEIDTELTSKNLKVIRYETEIEPYKLNELFKEIGSGASVVIVLSEKYLAESIYCQWEIKEIVSNKSLEDRVFPIFSKSAPNIFDSKEKKRILKKAKDLISEEAKKVDSKTEKLKVKYYKVTIDDFLNELKNRANWSYQHNEIKKLVNNIKKRIKINLPHGIKELDFEQTETEKYYKYLSEDTLPYIRRSQFKNENSIEEFTTELDIYDDIFFNTENEIDGVFILGEGGIGKTRLTLELGKTAYNNGYIVYEITNHFEEWNTLDLNLNAKYCFLFDYVELSMCFNSNIIRDLKNRYNGIEIKIIANARNTYAEDHDVILKYFKTVKFKRSDDLEKKYLKYVVNKILENHEKEIKKQFKFDIGKIVNKPSFAIFLIEGLLKYQTIDFHEIDDFNEYICKRLSLTFGDDKFNKLNKEIFMTIASLPISEKNLTDDVDDKIIKPLLKDGWIERSKETNEFKASYNDTIIDELLISYLRNLVEDDYFIKKEFISFFDFSIKYSYFEHCFISFGRISDKSILKNKNNKKALEEIFTKNYLKEIKDIGIEFVKSPLLDSFKKLKILFDNNILPLESEDFSYVLSNVMKKNNIYEEKEIIEKIFVNWVSYQKNIIKYKLEHEGSFLIPAYYNFFKESKETMVDIDETSYYWIDNYSNVNGADFVFNAYLEYANTFKDIGDYIIKWLEIYNKYDTLEAAYLIGRYLKRPEIKLIKSINNIDFIITKLHRFIINWLNNNIENEGYTLVLKEYLKKVNDVDSIKDTVDEWINKNKEDKSFSFILPYYISKIDNVDNIKDTVEKWINKNKDHEKFSYVVCEYLKKTKNLIEIEDTVEEWINKNKNHEDFLYVVSDYLKKAKEQNNIKDTVESWINNNINDESFSYVVAKYIKYSNDISMIQKTIEKWINGNIDHKDFDFVASKYVKYSNSCNVKETVEKWIKCNLDHKGFYHVAYKYLKYSSNTGNVMEAVEKWIKNNPNNEKSQQLMELIK